MTLFEHFQLGDVRLKNYNFVCQQTGKCCSHIRGFIGEKEKEFFEEFAYGKLPLVQIIPIEKISFPLWDWEAKRFIEGANKKNIDHKIGPSRVVFDQLENQTIIFTYSIDSDSCTFLNSGKCEIYQDRAFICRLFPFQKSPFLKTDDEFSKESLFGSCPSIKHIVPNIPENFKDMIKFLHQNFGNNFESAVENDHITSWINQTIIDLMKQKVIKPTMNYPYEFLLKRIEKSKKIDLTDFLIEKGIYSQHEMEDIINKFETNYHAKLKLKEVFGNDFDSGNECPGS
ncbi:YkgJ family cysteine cluster protein [Nanoarchaeota archaeon]